MADLIQPSRRGFLRGLGLCLAAPAIVRVASLMPVHALAPEFSPIIFTNGAMFIPPGAWMIRGRFSSYAGTFDYIEHFVDGRWVRQPVESPA